MQTKWRFFGMLAVILLSSSLSLAQESLWLEAEHLDGMPEGWEHGIKRIKELAERRSAGAR